MELKCWGGVVAVAIDPLSRQVRPSLGMPGRHRDGGKKLPPVEACKIYFGVVFCEIDFFKVKAQKRTRVHQFDTTQKSEVACTFYILQKHHN